MKNEENLIVLFIIKMYILHTTQYTRHLNLNFFVLLLSYRNTIINQSACVFSLSYFLIIIIALGDFKLSVAVKCM